MPPFGVVELYEYMKCNSDCTKVMIPSLLQLTFYFLLEYFNLIVFHSRQATNLIDDEKMRFKRFMINDELHYRATAY